jgi:hypothetical protein
VTLGTTMAVGVLLCSCAPEGPPTSSPTPVAAPTPSASTPTESPQEREERLAYEGAEKAYRNFITEYARVVRVTDRPHVTQAMREHATGDYLKAYTAFIKQRRKARLRSSGPAVIGRVDRVAYNPNRVLLTVCEDGSKARVVDRQGKTVGRGQIRTIDLTVRRSGSHWLVSDGDNEKRVKSCAE